MTVLAVFFPSLMGFGILVSGALLVSDAVQKLLPHEGRRRKRRVAIGARGVVAAAARSAGRDVLEPRFLRRVIRSRTEYFGVALLATGAFWLTVVGGVEAYDDMKGVFYASPWIAGLTIGFGIAFGLAAVGALALALVHRRAPQPVHWVIERTIVGRLRIPDPEDAVADVAKGGRP